MSSANLQSKRAEMPQPEIVPPEKATPLSDTKKVEQAPTEVGSEEKQAVDPLSGSSEKVEIDAAKSQDEVAVSAFVPPEESKKRSINEVSNLEGDADEKAKECESEPCDSKRARPNDFESSTVKAADQVSQPEVAEDKASNSKMNHDGDKQATGEVPAKDETHQQEAKKDTAVKELQPISELEAKDKVQEHAQSAEAGEGESKIENTPAQEVAPVDEALKQDIPESKPAEVTTEAAEPEKAEEAKPEAVPVAEEPKVEASVPVAETVSVAATEPEATATKSEAPAEEHPPKEADTPEAK